MQNFLELTREITDVQTVSKLVLHDRDLILEVCVYFWKLCICSC